jgi:hypothetical protein
MTEQKVIETLEYIRYCNDYKACAESIALDMAIKAMEKQIPKKPDIEGDGYDPDGNLVYDTWICPNCEEHYEIDYDYYDYCPKCGQAIDNSFRDWSEEE